MKKGENPYTRLVLRAREWVREVCNPHQRLMWFYAAEGIKRGESWPLKDLRERVQAADQLGYDVVLSVTERGLEVLYRKRASAPPWEIA